MFFDIFYIYDFRRFFWIEEVGGSEVEEVVGGYVCFVKFL